MKLAEDYIINQPDKYRTILLHIISVVEQELPNSLLLLKWGIPYFYFNKKPFCYLAPNHKKGFVDIGFAKGYQLKNYQCELIGENRNTVKSLRYFGLEEIDNEVLRGVITEAKSLYK
ncbi:MAG: DUF1801 domain-containing protein [Flavobacterium sp.]|jgi:hypothetical protein